MTDQPRRERTLDTAKSLISGQRAKDYGDAHESFERIAAIWTAILGTPVSAGQAALMLAGLKMARLAQSIDHEDSWIDLAGYAALGSEVAGKREPASLQEVFTELYEGSVSKSPVHHRPAEGSGLLRHIYVPNPVVSNRCVNCGVGRAEEIHQSGGHYDHPYEYTAPGDRFPGYRPPAGTPDHPCEKCGWPQSDHAHDDPNEVGE